MAIDDRYLQARSAFTEASDNLMACRRRLEEATARVTVAEAKLDAALIRLLDEAARRGGA